MANETILVQQSDDRSESTDLVTKLLGTTNISELRRENGQIYRIEFEHSSGSKQVIEEFNTDGQINSRTSDIAHTPTLSKWRLGSW